MAENKKSFLIYCDIIHTVEKLIIDDRKNKTNNTGELFFHLLEYVNDRNPIPVSMLIDISFEPIKQQLKRDLIKWELTSTARSEIGRIGGIKSGEARRTKSKQNEATEPIGLKSKQNEHDTVTVNVNDTVTVNVDYKKILLSEINSDDYKINEDHLEIAKSFQQLFINNLRDVGIENSAPEKAKGTWIDDIRLMLEVDKRTVDQCKTVFKFLKINDFWKANILSTSKLRKQFENLLIKSKYEKRQSSGNTTKSLLEEMEAIISGSSKY